MVITRQGLTLDEFLKLPEEKPSLEYWNGVIEQKVSPKAKHSRLQGILVEWINRFARPAGIAEAFPELRWTYAGVSVVPDVSVYRADRVPYDERGILVDDFWEPADIAIEIVSPEQSVNRLIRRCLWYVAYGVRIALLLDPDDESVSAFRQGKETLVLRGADRVNLDEVLPGFELTVAEIFQSLRRNEPRK